MDGKFVQEAPPGVRCGIILDRSIFYAEGGGQAPDRGEMKSGVSGKITETKIKELNYNITIRKGNLQLSQVVLCCSIHMYTIDTEIHASC